MDNTTVIRYGNSVANKSAVVTEMLAADIRYSVNQLDRESAMKHFSQATGSQNITTSTVRNSYYGIVHPDVEQDIRQLSSFIGVEQYGGYTDTLVGEFGALEGVRFVVSEMAPVETGAGTTSIAGSTFRGAGAALNDIYTSYVYGKEAVGSIGLGNSYGSSVDKTYEGKLSPIEIIQKSPGSSGIGDMFNEVGSVAWKAWFAGKILNDKWITKVVTLAKVI